jgi:UDP-GlcNAc:undecaprenyl-phosphate GlcNAc-1-phosphate transferase
MILLVLALGLVAFLIAVPGCAVMIAISRRFGFLDAPGSEPHKVTVGVNVKPSGSGRVNSGGGGGGVPNIGGVAVFAALSWPMLAVLLGIWLIPQSTWTRWDIPLAVHLPGLRATSAVGGGLLAGLAVIHVLGLVDDRRNLGAGIKLFVQFVVALSLTIWSDARVLTFLDDWGLVGLVASFAVSLFWIVAITNAMNFLDNMDGLAAGIGLIIGSIYLVATLLAGQWFVAALAALLVGSLLGFLIFNLPPAKLYLGDSGSLVLGLMLAVLSIRTTYVQLDPGQTDSGAGPWHGLLIPLLVMAVPLYDFLSVSLIRILSGQSPFTGDHNHFSHRLERLGLSRPIVLAVVYLATLATGLGGVMLGQLDTWQAAVVAVQALCVLAVIAVLEQSIRQ